MGRKVETPESYTGPREVVWRKSKCGWCIDRLHETCVHEIPYYEKLWICGCECNKNWKPQAIGTKTEENKSDKRRKRGREDNRTVDDDSAREQVADDSTTDAIGDNSDPEAIED
jgi:hypothetical protein